MMSSQELQNEVLHFTDADTGKPTAFKRKHFASAAADRDGDGSWIALAHGPSLHVAEPIEEVLRRVDGEKEGAA